jgi:hypothetical protein
MTRTGANLVLALAVPALSVVALVPAPALADSQMHQSPLLERGSSDACDDLRQGRRQRGSYSWQFSCAGVPRSAGQGGRRGR